LKTGDPVPEKNRKKYLIYLVDRTDRPT